MTISDGISNMPRRMSQKEKFADRLYVNLQIISRLLFILLGLVGYYFYGWLGAGISVIIGVAIGMWMRHSMGIRGSDYYIGFYTRMGERANGSRTGVLERMIEKARGNEFTQTKCQTIYKEYVDAMTRLSQCSTQSEKEQILMELDTKTKELSYD